jgi:hypothetical protein
MSEKISIIVPVSNEREFITPLGDALAAPVYPGSSVHIDGTGR